MSTPLTTITPSGIPRGGVDVVQEAFGVSDHNVDICRRLADAGPAAIGAPTAEEIHADAASDARATTLEWFDGHVAR